MFKVSRSQPWPPTLDLATVRETLAYVRDDMQRVPGLEKATAALSNALDEIRAAEAGFPKPVIGSTLAARFFPRR